MTRLHCFTAAMVMLCFCNSPAHGQTHTLSTGTGDASVSVIVSGAGAFGVASSGGAATYDPVGPGIPASTTFRSEVAFRMGVTGARTWLTGGTPTGTATSCTSTFTMGGMSVNLVQSVAPMMTGPVQTGSILTQAYTITNTGTTPASFEMVRYIDGDLLFDGTLVDGGGRLPGPPETLFETDAGGGATTSTTFLGITDSGGTNPATNRFDLENWSTLSGRVAAGTALNDAIIGDGNADQFIDAGSEYDVALALRTTFTLAASASVTYTTTTIFGSGVPTVPSPAGVTVTQSGGSTNVAEGGATDTYTVVLNTAPSANVTITLNPGPQLSVAPATLTFTTANWNTAQTVTVSAIDDAAVEGPHSGTITHTATSTDLAYNGIAIASVTVTITDNDSGGGPGPGPGPSPRGPEGSFGGSNGRSGPEGSFGFGGAGLRITPFAVLQGPYADAERPANVFVFNASHQKDLLCLTAELQDSRPAMIFLLGAVLALGYGAVRLTHLLRREVV